MFGVVPRCRRGGVLVFRLCWGRRGIRVGCGARSAPPGGGRGGKGVPVPCECRPEQEQGTHRDIEQASPATAPRLPVLVLELSRFLRRSVGELAAHLFCPPRTDYDSAPRLTELDEGTEDNVGLGLARRTTWAGFAARGFRAASGGQRPQGATGALVLPWRAGSLVSARDGPCGGVRRARWAGRRLGGVVPWVGRRRAAGVSVGAPFRGRVVSSRCEGPWALVLRYHPRNCRQILLQ